MKRQKMKYDWVPHEVRREQTENIVAYVLIGLFVLSVPLGVLIATVNGIS